MKELFELGISDSDINNMIELNKEIIILSSNDIKDKINILESIGCTNNQINNIISSNPLYLSRSNEDLFALLNTLKKYGFNTINILLDSNPYILNLDSYEIKDYIESRINNKDNIEDIIDELDSNPYLFNEI